jgi:hypothetical protein
MQLFTPDSTIKEPRTLGASQTADAEDHTWTTFAGATDTSAFCGSWLALQCRMIPASTAGLLLVKRDDATYAPAATWPDSRKDLGYLKKAAQTALLERRGVIQAAEPAGTSSNAVVPHIHVAYPIDVRGQVYGVVVLDVLSHPGVDLQTVLRQLHWGTGWLEGLFWRIRSESDIKTAARSTVALELLATADEHRHFGPAAIAVANELARRLRCDRVAIGFLSGARVRVRAVSHSAWFQRKSELIKGLENAMEEAYDQNASVSYPTVDLTRRHVSVAHLDFFKQWGVGSIASVTMRSKGRPTGVITLERHSEDPFDAEAILQAESAATALGPALGLKLRSDGLVAGRLRA